MTKKENGNPIIPDYTLLKRIGQGASGEVWLARGATKSYRAVKIIQSDRFQKAEHYEREFEALCRIETSIRNAQHVVQIHHVGRHDKQGFYYYVMDLADSLGTDPAEDPAGYSPVTLRELLRAGALEASTALDAGVRLAKGLDNLHSARLVHRDVKPANILLIDGRVQLGDLGLLVNELPDTGRLGTEGYVPPEGTGKPSGDLFALGKILYEMVTGEDRSEFPSIPSEVLEKEDWPLRNQLLEIANQCAAPEVAKRYASADELLGDLLEAEQKRPIRSEKKRIHFQQMTMAVAVAVAIIGGLLFVQNRNTKNQIPINILSPLGNFDRKEQNSAEFLEAFRGFLPEELEQWRKDTIPPRSPMATSKQLDLTPFYNADLNTTPHVGRNLAEATGNNLKQMPQGLQKFNGVLFDVRGLVVLNCKNMDISPPAIKEVPERVDGIPVNQSVSKLHFLHFCSWTYDSEEPVAHYRVRYESGKEQSIPIRDKKEIQDWWFEAFEFKQQEDGSIIRVVEDSILKIPSKTKLAWQGSNEFTESSRMRIRVYHYEWKNPTPTNAVASLSLESTMTTAAPTIIAITVE